MIVPELRLIAAFLEGLEETIIAKLIDRAQFRLNLTAYEPGKSGFSGEPDRSLFETRLRFQEEMDARFGRFHVPEERPFHHDLPSSRREVTLPPSPLRLDDFDLVNLSVEIKDAYLAFLPRFCQPGDDGQYGSSVEHDVAALQSIARRIHFGALHVAESKYRERPEEYRALAERSDREGLLGLLTRREVEDRIVARIRDKVAYAQERVNREVRIPIDPDAVASFYRDAIIPLTKEGEVRYLLNRTA